LHGARSASRGRREGAIADDASSLIDRCGKTYEGKCIASQIVGSSFAVHITQWGR